jgi:hypothetical protein
VVFPGSLSQDCSLFSSPQSSSGYNRHPSQDGTWVEHF